MPSAVVATLETLAHSHNEAAVGVLAAGLEGRLPSIRLGAIRALCRHESEHAKRALVARLHHFDADQREVFCHSARKFVDVLSEAVASEDPQQFENGCRGILWLLEVDAATALVPRLTPDADGTLAAETLWGLTELAAAAAAGRFEDLRRREGARLVAKTAAAVEAAMAKVREHGHAIVFHAYLRFARRDSRTLLELLRDATHPCHELAVAALENEWDEFGTNLAASFLGSSHVPKAVVEIISRRTDGPFLAAVGHRAAALQPSELRAVKQLPRPAWLDEAAVALPRLEPGEQPGLLRLACVFERDSASAQALLTAAMQVNHSEVQRTALDELSRIAAPWADELIREALASELSPVRAAAAALLRERPVPDHLTRLVAMLEDGNPEVESIARASLREFNARQFLATFDALDAAARTQAGALIARVDLEAADVVREAIGSRSHGQRMRGVQAAAAMGLVDVVWDELAAALQDAEAVVRSAAVEAIAEASHDEAAALLATAEQDASPMVREAAKRAKSARGAETTAAGRES